LLLDFSFTHLFLLLQHGTLLALLFGILLLCLLLSKSDQVIWVGVEAGPLFVSLLNESDFPTVAVFSIKGVDIIALALFVIVAKEHCCHCTLDVFTVFAVHFFLELSEHGLVFLANLSVVPFMNYEVFEVLIQPILILFFIPLPINFLANIVVLLIVGAYLGLFLKEPFYSSSLKLSLPFKLPFLLF
jgi:hypothetical protein